MIIVKELVLLAGKSKNIVRNRRRLGDLYTLLGDYPQALNSYKRGLPRHGTNARQSEIEITTSKGRFSAVT